MAIKPGDCVMRVADLIVGEEACIDMFGRPSTRPRYVPYWRNFMDHVDRLKSQVKWSPHLNYDPYEQVFIDELARYNAVFKRTRDYQGNYVKFQSHSARVMFILRWS